MLGPRRVQRHLCRIALPPVPSTAVRRTHRRPFATAAQESPYDDEYDVVVIGSGAGGLTAAITAAISGNNKVLIAEKTGFYGGTSAYSGGALWVPMSPVAARSMPDHSDTPERAKQYIQNFMASLSRETDFDETMIDAYLEAAPRMVDFLETHRATKFFSAPVPDYHTELDGSVTAGRTVLSQPYDGRRLGSELVKQVRYPLQGYCAFGSLQAHAPDLPVWTSPFSSLQNLATVTSSILRYGIDLIGYGKGTFLCNGNALVGRLLEAARNSDVQLWTNAAATSPIMVGNRVTGIVINKGNQGPARVRARKGVVLASGGFARSSALTKKYLGGVVDWTVSPRGNEGDGMNIGLASGACVPEPLGENAALWSAVSEIRPMTGKGPARYFPHLGLGLTKPGCIVVDPDGRRFANESASYAAFGKATRQAGVTRSYLIGTKAHLRRYGMGAALPAPYPFKQLEWNGYLVKAPTVPELAKKLGINPQRLVSTVDRFNEHAAKGQDPDFHRGEGTYDRSFGDLDHRPNPCLAPLDRGPFYAVPMFTGTVCTLFGLETDEDARVRGAAGKPVEGLYAIGSDANHFLRGHLPSGGLTLGPAMVFGYRAGLHLSR